MDTRRNRAPRIARTFWLSSLLILTLAGWVKRVAWWLNSLYELQLRTIQASPRVFCDETPMPVLDPGRHRTRICQFWAHAMNDVHGEARRRRRSPTCSPTAAAPRRSPDN